MPNETASAEPSELARVVLVDDDALFRESVEQNLRDAGFTVTTLANGEALVSHFSQGGAADLVLLDWRMPGMSGIEALRHLREAGSTVPVIFLTIFNDQIFEEAALSSGAVDFVEKSRSFSILLRRISLILDGAKGGEAGGGAGVGAGVGAPALEGDRLQVGPLDIVPGSHRAFWRGERVDLTLNEFRIVHCLATSGGRDVGYRELYDLVRGSGFAAGSGPLGYRANVRTMIKRIRKKFRDIDDTFDRIENYPGFGYRYRAE